MHARYLSVILGGCAAALLAACSSTPTVNIDYDRRYDFSGVHLIHIRPMDRANPASVVVSDMQVERINAALSAELERRGFEIVADSADADMFLAWHLVTQERSDVRSFNSVSFYNCWSCVGVEVGSVDVREYNQGTFIVDMIDPVKLRSVWRGIYASRLWDESDPERAAQDRREAARAIFAEFPPPPGDAGRSAP